MNIINRVNNINLKSNGRSTTPLGANGSFAEEAVSIKEPPNTFDYEKIKSIYR